MQTERRLHPRKSLTVPVQVLVPEGSGVQAYHATTINLSEDGIQLSCNRAIVLSLLEQEQYPPTCQLVFSLPDEQAEIHVDARLVVNRRLAADHHCLGFSLVSFKDGGEALLTNYLR